MRRIHSRSPAPFNAAPFAALRDDALSGVRLGLVEAHVPRAQMSVEALAMWDRAVADLRAAGAVVEPFAPAVTLATYRNAFTEAARARGDVVPDSRSPAATANALLTYFAGRTSDARAAIRRGYAAYRSFYDVLPATFEECEPLLDRPMANDPAGQSFARSRAEAVASLGASMRAAGVVAMVYPTMPFNAPRAADKWPDIRTALGYGNFARPPGGVCACGARRRWNARAQSVSRRAADGRRSDSRAGARVRAAIAALRRTATHRIVIEPLSAFRCPRPSSRRRSSAPKRS